MGISPIGMIGFQPYVYNVNQVNANSLSKIQKISGDVTKSRTDFNGLLEDEITNLNPLHKGETLNFDDMLDMQFQIGKNNAERLFNGSIE